MHVLVTGGAGFIGSNFVHHLLETTEHEVTTLDTLTYAGRLDNLEGALDDQRHRFVEGDIREDETVRGLIAEVDALVNFAAQTHVDRSIEEGGEFVDTNVKGTQRLLEAAIDSDIERFLQISTDEVYGEILEGKFTEDDPFKPNNPYAATKASADLLCRSYRITHGVPVTIVRPSNNYGPHQHEEKLIPKLIRRANRGETLPIYGDGTNVREWIFVTDTCRAIDRILVCGEVGETYNVGSGVELENVEVARAIIDLVGDSVDQIEFVDDRPGHDRRYALECSKVRGLGWIPQVTFRAGLEKTTAFYLDK